MKYFSMFSGIGGFELGIQRAYNIKKAQEESNKESRKDSSLLDGEPSTHRWCEPPSCIGYSEINKYSIQTYNKHFGGHKNYGNAKDINAEQLPSFDLLVGGFPCQAFSIAGKRRGFEDTRGTLFFDIARILKAKQPRLFLLENVKGLLNHDGGETFTTILQTIDELGYDAEWQVLNSKHFGVPQNRERVFIIGHLRGSCGRQVFPIGSSNSKALKQIIGGGQGNRVYSTDGVATTQASQAGGQGAKTGLYAIPVLTPDRPEKRQNGRRFKEDGEPMFTLTGQDKHGILKDSRIRRLTPRECERLQGFPDDFSKYGINEKGETVDMSDTQRYKQLGNAVTVNVIEAIMEKIGETI